MNAQVHYWEYLKSNFFGEEQLRVTEAELVSLVKAGLIKETTKVCSFTRTKGQWSTAGTIPSIAKLLAQVKQDQELQRDAEKQQRQLEPESEKQSRNEQRDERREAAKQQREAEKGARIEQFEDEEEEEEKAGAAMDAQQVSIKPRLRGRGMFILTGVLVGIAFPLYVLVLRQVDSAPQEASVSSVYLSFVITLYIISRCVEKS